MGYYIETGTNTQKANILRQEYGATLATIEEARETFKTNSDKGVIVVVNNGFFEAAAFAYDEGEFSEFVDNPHDHREKTILLMDRNLAEELSGYKR